MITAWISDLIVLPAAMLSFHGKKRVTKLNRAAIKHAGAALTSRAALQEKGIEHETR